MGFILSAVQWRWSSMINLRMRILFLLTIFMVPAVMATAESGDWPEFRGPTGQGIAENAKPPLKWSQTENVVWKKEIPGRGWSSPIVYQGSVYLTTAIVDATGNPTSLQGLRIDAKTGETLWNREVFTLQGRHLKHDKNSYASPTPIIEDGRIYFHFGHLGTACLNGEGEILWLQSDLKYDSMHGNAGSPILVGDKLIFNCDGTEQPFVAALNKFTGKVTWKVNRKPVNAENKFSFSTPLMIEENGQKAVVSPGSGAVCAYDPENGNELWRVDYGSGFSVIPRPVYGHGMVFIATGFGETKVRAIRLGGDGDVTNTHLVWEIDSYAPKTPSMLLVGNELYFVSDNGRCSCVDAITGKQYWRENFSGNVSASPVFADGRIYITTEKGKILVIKAGTVFEKLAENDMQERTFASPAVSGNALFIRSESHLYRIDLK
ncbi:MAG: serine/threonine protein kinase [Candidatus Brocadiia bacterium]|nr:MAG: serine/threonine protein kinase [Candidatus Brocadiia bacterium]